MDKYFLEIITEDNNRVISKSFNDKEAALNIYKRYRIGQIINNSKIISKKLDYNTIGNGLFQIPKIKIIKEEKI